MDISDMKLPLFLGKKLNGENLIVDLTKLPHLLIGGLTGCGKSNLIINIVDELAARLSSDEVNFLLIDPKMVQFSNLAERVKNYLYRPVETSSDGAYTEIHEAYNAVSALLEEMERRYTILRKNRCRSINEFNSKNETKLPYIVLVIDEYADLLLSSSQFDDFSGDEEDEETGIEGDREGLFNGRDTFISDILRLAQIARAVGIHVILSTQQLSVNIINGYIKANYPARIAFKVQNKRQSKIVLDESGAEKLESPGDFIWSSRNCFTLSSYDEFIYAHAPLSADYSN